MSIYAQGAYEIRCEWGGYGVELAGAGGAACVIVDVFSFSTCVDVATARGAKVYPYRSRDSGAAGFAKSLEGFAAGPRQEGGYSLSPASLVDLPPGRNLVLPSPNGSTLTLSAEAELVIAGCLRNAPAVAERLAGYGGAVTIVPAGERWPDGSLRPAIEDLIGAGAIIHGLRGPKSPEARIAESAFLAVRGNLLHVLKDSVSGRELCDMGFPQDVDVATEFDVSTTVPVFSEGCFVAG